MRGLNTSPTEQEAKRVTAGGTPGPDVAVRFLTVIRSPQRAAVRTQRIHRALQRASEVKSAAKAVHLDSESVKFRQEIAKSLSYLFAPTDSSQS
ncbi:MAG TPA: hypothetical protein DCG12_24195 [Planctomycetaceae bacterium]|nr:hypothetical protein [Planctomycetaceae bacterium]